MPNKALTVVGVLVLGDVGPARLLLWLAGVMNAGGVDLLQCCVLGESGAVTYASMLEACTFILLPLGSMLASGHWSFYGER
jgi:hypothetical protein